MLTIKTWLEGIGLTAPTEECPAWPPDLFALAGTLIRRSGAYLRVFRHRNPGTHARYIEEQAQQWRNQLDAITAAYVTPADLQRTRTSDIRAGWARLMQKKDIPISDINNFPELAEQLIRLTQGTLSRFTSTWTKRLR